MRQFYPFWGMEQLGKRQLPVVPLPVVRAPCGFNFSSINGNLLPYSVRRCLSLDKNRLHDATLHGVLAV